MSLIFLFSSLGKLVSGLLRIGRTWVFILPLLAPAQLAVYASVNSSCAHPPPGNCGAFACLVSPGGGALANLARPGGRAFAYPRAFDTHVVSDSKSKHEGFYRKGPAVRRRLDRLPRTGQTCGGFLDFMHFFIAYQGTTIT